MASGMLALILLVRVFCFQWGLLSYSELFFSENKIKPAKFGGKDTF